MTAAVPFPSIVVAPVIATVADGSGFPVRRIYCVGQNYADHAREMGSNPDRQAPFFFMKPADAIVPSGRQLSFPPATQNLHHEIELVVALERGGSLVDAGDAEAMIFGYAVGLDMTRRDIQAEAKKNGRPWDMAKGFDESAPLGAIVRGVPPRNAAIRLSINGQVRQQGDIDQMIWSVPEIIAHLSHFVSLAPGDLIFTGTPAGVGRIESGDVLIGTIGNCPPIEISYAR